MILKRNFNPLKVAQYIQFELFISLAISLLVFVAFKYQIINTGLPFSIVGIMGSALAIFIAFRNNTSYSRWWEARTAWSGITNACRVLGRLIITFTDSHQHQTNYDKKRSEDFKKEMIYATIAYVHAMRIELRKQNNWNEIEALLPNEIFSRVKNAFNIPNQIQLYIGQKIYEAMSNGTLGGFDSFQIEGQLLALTNHQGTCERIKNTPLLRQYDFFTRIFLYAFIIVFPFAIVKDFMQLESGYLIIPLSLLIAFIFSVMGKVGEVNEDPFENRITDIPLSAICNTIERDLKEMLGETNLPRKIEQKDGYLP